jgi:putative transcriptional regulator
MQNRLKEIRLKQGLTQQEIAFQANISLTHLRNIEYKKVIPSIEVALKIKNVLGCENVEEVFSLD